MPDPPAKPPRPPRPPIKSPRPTPSFGQHGYSGASFPTKGHGRPDRDVHQISTFFQETMQQLTKSLASDDFGRAAGLIDILRQELGKLADQVGRKENAWQAALRACVQIAIDGGEATLMMKDGQKEK